VDMTNFATFIDSANEQAPIAQRGKAKQKRNDLRLVGLGLVVTRDGGVPVLSHAYAGDRPDVTQFTAVIDELLARYRALCQQVESLTVVYDAGQNSAANHARIEQTGIGFVGSLPPSDHPGLLAIPTARYVAVDAARYPGLACVDTTVTALGVTRRAVVTHSPTPGARLRPDPGQGPPPPGRAAGPPGPRTHPPRPQCRRARDHRNPAAPLGRRGHHRHPHRGCASRLPPVLAHRPGGPPTPGGPHLRQADPVHQPRRLDYRRGRRRLPLPVRGRSRVPSAQGPTGGVV
jgi:hypothetical protein